MYPESQCINHPLHACIQGVAINSQRWEFYHKPRWPMTSAPIASPIYLCTFEYSRAMSDSYRQGMYSAPATDIIALALPFLLLSPSKLPFACSVLYSKPFQRKADWIKTIRALSENRHERKSFVAERMSDKHVALAVMFDVPAGEDYRCQTKDWQQKTNTLNS